MKRHQEIVKISIILCLLFGLVLSTLSKNDPKKPKLKPVLVIKASCFYYCMSHNCI